MLIFTRRNTPYLIYRFVWMSLKIKALNLTIILMLSWLGLFFGYLIGSFFVTRESGLEGVALVFWCGIGGLVVLLLSGIVLVLKMHIKMKTNLFWVLLIVSGLVAGWLALRFYQLNTQKKTAISLPKATSTPVHFASYPTQQKRQPLGLGIASVILQKEAPLYFYSSSQGSIADSITFRFIQQRVEIQTAPPWLFPEYIKMDYEVLLFRVTTETQTMIEVVVNRTTGKRAWIKKDQTAFRYWPAFLLSISSVKSFDAEQNPVRLKPLDHASAISMVPNEPLRPIAIDDSWILVGVGSGSDQLQTLGWLRWKRADSLTVSYSIFE